MILPTTQPIKYCLPETWLLFPLCYFLVFICNSCSLTSKFSKCDSLYFCFVCNAVDLRLTNFSSDIFKSFFSPVPIRVLSLPSIHCSHMVITTAISPDVTPSSLFCPSTDPSALLRPTLGIYVFISLWGRGCFGCSVEWRDETWAHLNSHRSSRCRQDLTWIWPAGVYLIGVFPSLLCTSFMCARA